MGLSLRSEEVPKKKRGGFRKSQKVQKKSEINSRLQPGPWWAAAHGAGKARSVVGDESTTINRDRDRDRTGRRQSQGVGKER
jgi:hypothetical protein